VITFLYLKNGSIARGISTLFINTTKNRILLASEGRYTRKVGALKSISKPYNGINRG
jgi:hypothetical protein